MPLTEQQRDAVFNRNGKLLVSAAAGSGKTKVLVDRLMSYISESHGKINIDDFLIITYTHAAAAELRSKIAAKLSEKLAEDPGNWHLQRQVQRLYMAKISTVHSFCGDILHEFAYQLDIPGDFRIADEKESRLLKYQVLERLMESIFAEADRDILNFIDSQELGRNDKSVPPVILQVYDSAMCHKHPDVWLEDCMRSCQVDGIKDASETIWGSYLIRELHYYLDLQISALEKCAQLADECGTMPKPAALLQDTLNQLKQLRSKETWDGIVESKNIEYGTLSFPKKDVDPELVERIKEVRKQCKKRITTKLVPFADKSATVLPDLKNCSSAISGLIKLVKRFQSDYEHAKKIRRVLDFTDLEHKMLELLLGKNRQGITKLAHEIGERFHEIMVDEYQDSNEVQDAIFSALTDKRQNCFMVGDVKQSIYQFRMADPSIFLQKYDEYVSVEKAKDGQGRKVMLSSNFRSAGAVIEAVNDVFHYCMSKRVGGLVYDSEVQLNEGIPHTAVNETEVELTMLEIDNDTYAEDASYTANRIAELLDGTHMVRDGDTLRPMIPDDIAILLRSPKSSGAVYQAALEEKGFRVNSGSGINILETEEIVFLRSMLQVISNPLQDIPLISVLASRIFCFDANELSEIKTQNSRRYFYDSLKQSKNEKAIYFVNLLEQLRKSAQLSSVSEVISQIFASTRMDSIFSSFEQGTIKSENLRMLADLAVQCEKSNIRHIDQFLDYLDSLEDEGVTKPAEYKIPGSITILSIHKSKGLEFPVVFLCGLSRDFSKKSIQSSVLCNRELGIGLNCIDQKNRVNYPSIAKKAIAAKILSDGLSEEMRVLYVAMTRARDRLIMTYPIKNPEKELREIANRMDICDTVLLTMDAMCPGEWILMSALHRIEAGEFFALCYRPAKLKVSNYPWRLSIDSANDTDTAAVEYEETEQLSSQVDLDTMSQTLHYSYPFQAATNFPSKQTATQLKGRYKDQESAENTFCLSDQHWRLPAFDQDAEPSGVKYGNAVHAVMQFISFTKCSTIDGIKDELHRLVCEKIILPEIAEKINVDSLYQFFVSELGQKLINAQNVLREFKFSILDDAGNYSTGMHDEQILLQGVVDCAIIESDGITVIDFKTDRVTTQTIDSVAGQYILQVKSYADAISRIYQLPIKSASLYFFRAGKVYTVI